MRAVVRQWDQGEMVAGRRRLAAATCCFRKPKGARNELQITMFQHERQGDAATACPRPRCCSWRLSAAACAGGSRISFRGALEIEAQARASASASITRAPLNGSQPAQLPLLNRNCSRLRLVGMHVWNGAEFTEFSVVLHACCRLLVTCVAAGGLRPQLGHYCASL